MPQSGLGVAAARYHLREPEEISGSGAGVQALKINQMTPMSGRRLCRMQLKDYDKALHDYNEAIKLARRKRSIRCGRSFTRTRVTLKPRCSDTKNAQARSGNADAQSRKKFLDAKLRDPDACANAIRPDS